MTGATAVNGALELVHVIRPGQTPATTESAEALAICNRMLESWSTDRLLVPVVGFARYALTANQAAYPIGVSASAPFNVARPIRIDAAGIVQTVYNAGTGDFRSDLEIISEREYVSIKDKTATSDVPERLYYAPGVANGTIYLWPTPNVSTATQLELSTWTALSQFADLVTDVPVAPGYQRAIITNLAIELVAAFPAAMLDQSTAVMAQESKAYIMRLNSQMVPQMPDAATPPTTNQAFQPVPSALTAIAKAKGGQ